MFYSHEVLTSREGGIATIWLVATLGSSTKHRKITRKTIMDVDVSHACKIIIEPAAPMALRLQSNLLYGVARVLSKQFEYVLSDAQLTQTQIRTLLKAVRTSDLDPNAGRAAPEQLVIEDDPGFLPDAALPGLDIDLATLGISSDESNRRASIFSPPSMRSSLSSRQDSEVSMVELAIPSSESGGGDIGGFQLPSGSFVSATRHSTLRRPFDDEDDVMFDPGFIVGDDGDIIENMPEPAPMRPGEEEIGGDQDSGVGVRESVTSGLQRRQPEHEVPPNFDIPMKDLDPYMLPDAEPFPIGQQTTVERTENDAFAKDPGQTLEGTDTRRAPLLRSRRKIRILSLDDQTQIPAATWKDWQKDYAANMHRAKAIKNRKTAGFLAKKHATQWTTGLGIGGSGRSLGRSKIKSQLASFFSGPGAVEFLVGSQDSSTAVQRSRDDGHEEDIHDEAQVQRVVAEDINVPGEGGSLMFNEDDDVMLPPESEDIEIGRHGQTSLEDQSFPWNTTASARGSRQGSVPRSWGYQSSIGGFSANLGPASSLPRSVRPSSIDRRASRMSSASPLVGHRAHRHSSLGATVPGEQPLEGEELDVHDFDIPDSFELFGPAAAVDTQTAAQSQWMRDALTHEAGNFLSFVQSEIEIRAATVANEGLATNTTSQQSIEFGDLLPPTQHSKIVAAQALHHVLALASGGQLDVNQVQAFGPIDLSIPEIGTGHAAG